MHKLLLITPLLILGACASPKLPNDGFSYRSCEDAWTQKEMNDCVEEVRNLRHMTPEQMALYYNIHTQRNRMYRDMFKPLDKGVREQYQNQQRPMPRQQIIIEEY